MNIEQNIIINTTNEIWKDIPQYKDIYQVSNYGRIKSLSRLVKNCRRQYISKEKILSPNICRGYLIITLYKNNKPKIYRINRIVAEVFIPNPNNLPQVNHRNMIKFDNKMENLEWCDSLYNNRHAHKNKTFKKPVGNRKIDENQVKKIKILWKNGNITQAKIAKIFNLAPNTISYIINNKRWTNVII